MLSSIRHNNLQSANGNFHNFVSRHIFLCILKGLEKIYVAHVPYPYRVKVLWHTHELTFFRPDIYTRNDSNPPS